MNFRVFKVPTINQDTGIAGPEPSNTLKKIRSDTVLRPTGKQQGKVCISSICRALHHVPSVSMQ